MLVYLSSFFGAFASGFFAALLFVFPLKAAKEARRIASTAADIRD